MKTQNKVIQVNEETGEINEIKYMKGSPKQYRFNGQQGRFNIDGTQDIGTRLEIHPIAWRVFTDSLFGRGRRDEWAEIFFVDAENCVSSIMFNNSSVLELSDLLPRLFYAQKELSDVVLTITSDKKETEKDGQKKTWYIAKFAFEAAPEEEIRKLKEFAQANEIYRHDTINASAEYRTVSTSYPLVTALQISEIPEQAKLAA